MNIIADNGMIEWFNVINVSQTRLNAKNKYYTYIESVQERYGWNDPVNIEAIVSLEEASYNFLRVNSPQFQ